MTRFVLDRAPWTRLALTPRDQLVGQFDGHVKVGQVQVIPGAVAEGDDAGLGQGGVAVCAHSARQANDGLSRRAHVPHLHGDVGRHVPHVSCVPKVQLLAELIQVLQNSLQQTDPQHNALLYSKWK